MSDDTLRERINREFERESDDLERRLQERQIADPELAAMKMPDDSFDDLMRRIAAEQKETEPVSGKHIDMESSRKPFRIRKRVLLSVAAAAVLVAAMGVGATGAKLFVPKVENSSEDGEFNTTIINGDIEEKRDIFIIYENKQIDKASFDKKIDGEVIDTIESFYLNKELSIVQIDKGNGTYSYTIQMEQGNAYYYLISELELDEFKNIVTGIYFESV